jgi:hypothetical protein
MVVYSKKAVKLDEYVEKRQKELEELGKKMSKPDHEVGIEEHSRIVDRNFTRISYNNAWISSSECVKLVRRIPTQFLNAHFAHRQTSRST